jgi:proteic killer suppression protein
MNIEYDNEYLRALFEGSLSRGKPKYQKDVINRFIKTVNILRGIPRIETLYQLNSLNYEKLSGDDLSSVRVTSKYRLEFLEIKNQDNEVICFVIKELSNHYS